MRLSARQTCRRWRETWGRVRQRLLRKPVMRAIARLVYVWPLCRRARGSMTMRPSSPLTFRPSPTLSVGFAAIAPFSPARCTSCGPDQLHGFRAAADDRHLSRRLQLDAGLGSPRASAEAGITTHAGSGSRGGVMRALEPSSISTTEAALHGRARDFRHRAIAGSCGRIPAGRPRSPHPHDPFAAPQRCTGDLYRDEDIDMPAPGDSALDAHSRRVRHVCAMDPGAGVGGPGARRASRLLRRDRLYRRPARSGSCRRCQREMPSPRTRSSS